VVKKVRGCDIESGAIILYTVVGNGCCKVSLATATGTSQDQPSSGFVSKSPGGFIGVVKLLLINRLFALALR